jgi:hypothetical protein
MNAFKVRGEQAVLVEVAHAWDVPQLANSWQSTRHALRMQQLMQGPACISQFATY